jgi:hypothetical protein
MVERAQTQTFAPRNYTGMEYNNVNTSRMGGSGGYPAARMNWTNPLNPGNYGKGWTNTMIGRENKNQMTLSAELKSLEDEIRGYVQQGYFTNDPTILSLVNVFYSVLRFTANRLHGNINRYDNKAMARASQNKMIAEADGTQYSVYGLKGNGVEWITSLYNKVYALMQEGCFTGRRSVGIVNDFLELLKVASKSGGFLPIVDWVKRKGRKFLPFLVAAVVGVSSVVGGDSNQLGDGGMVGNVTPPGTEMVTNVQQQKQQVLLNFANGSYQLNQNEAQNLINSIQDGDMVTIYVQGNQNPYSRQQQLDQNRVNVIKQAIMNSGKQVSFQESIGPQGGPQAYANITITHGGGGAVQSLEESINRIARDVIRKYLR